MTSKRDSSSTQQQESEMDLTATYNKFKTFEGRRYTGVKVGRGHKWYYDRGEWKEKKITPDHPASSSRWRTSGRATTSGAQVTARNASD